MPAVVHEALADGLQPSERLTVSEWADRHRMLSSKSSKEHGPWRTARTPYLRAIMDALSEDSPYNTIVFPKGSQIGASEAGWNWVLYSMDHAPGPMLSLMPTELTSREQVKNRLEPAIEACPSIVDALHGQENTLGYKEVPGGAYYFRGSNSPVGLASISTGRIWFDEPDRYPRDSGGEGSPLALAERRAATFGDRRKLFYTSTPTIEGQSRIWEMWEATDRRYYHVPCPHCGTMQPIVWPRIKWDSPTSPPWLECLEGCVIEERHKPRMLADGEWIATARCSDQRTIGFHLSSLYSPLGWYSWASIRDDFLKAKARLKQHKDPTNMKTWVNTVLGECWAEAGEAPAWEKLYARREDYPRNEVPEGGLVLTAAVDVQADRLEVEIKAWGPRAESWSIDHRTLVGQISDIDAEGSAWRELDEVLVETWPHALGGRLGVSKMVVDSGDQTQVVYSWCRRHVGKVMAIKGSDSATLPISAPRPVDVRQDGVVIKHGLHLTTVGVSLIKSEIYGWLNAPRGDNDGPPPMGWTHWPEYPDEFFKQLTAEVLRTRYVRGYPKPQWEKTRTRNEALDLAVYNRAAAIALGLDRWTDKRWDAIRAQLGAPTASDPATPQAAGAKKPRKRPRSKWLYG